MTNDKIIEITSLCKSFAAVQARGRKKARSLAPRIIDDLSLGVPNRTIMALIGGNAAGKTTLFNLISGFLQPTSGEISYATNGDRVSLIGKKPYQISRMGIGRLFQNDLIFPNMSILDNMLVAAEDQRGRSSYSPLRVWCKENEREIALIDRADRVFEDLFGAGNEFWDRRDKPARDLSFGQRRLLAIARLFMGKYRLILMDEPTSGINPEYIDKVIRITRRLVAEKGNTVFLIEHNMEVVLKMADFCCFMSQGKIAAMGTPADVIGNDAVRKTYLGI